MGFCNDCGAKVADKAALVAHAKTAHDGLPRIRYWDGKAETMYSPDGKDRLRFVPVGGTEDRKMIYEKVE